MAEPRAHVYLLRGLMNIFSLGMDTLGEELSRRGVYATVYNHADWQALADQAAASYKAGKEGPIIIIGHSLGADAAMEMANSLGARGVPVALVVPFDGTQSLAAGTNVARVLNLTQRSYAYMRRGAGFHGTLSNVDVSSDPSIDHLNIDKSPRLHARVISEVLAVVGNHRMPVPGGTKPAVTPATASGEGSGPKAEPVHATPDKPEEPTIKPEEKPTPPAAPAVKSGAGAMNSTAVKPVAESGVPSAPESTATVTPPRKPAATPKPASSPQVPD